jgi:phage repressor protein C with HTH and peptisase S24 domain
MDMNAIRVANLARLASAEKNKATFARKYGLDPTYLSQILTGHRSIGEKSARNLEEKLNLDPFTLDKSDEHEATKLSLRPVQVWENEDELDPALYVFLPALNIKLSAGSGNLIWEVDQKGQKQAFTAKWIKRMHIDPGSAATMIAEGSSMEPRVLDGDSLVVDYEQQTIRDGKVYAITIGEEYFVKRLFKEIDNSLRIVSDNPDKARYPDRLIPPELTHLVQIIGRIVAISGSM